MNKFVLTGDRFIPDLHLGQPGFTQSAWGLFTKYCGLKRIKNLEKQKI